MNLFWLKILVDEVENVLSGLSTQDTPHLAKPVADARAAVNTLRQSIIDGPPPTK